MVTVGVVEGEVVPVGVGGGVVDAHELVVDAVALAALDAAGVAAGVVEGC